MNQLMPELILQEEDETMSEIMFGFASGDNDEEETAQGGGDSVPVEGGGVVIGENGSRKKRGRPRLQDSEKGGGVSGDPLSERKDHGNHKKHLCSLCGQTLTGLTAYNRHQV